MATRKQQTQAWITGKKLSAPSRRGRSKAIPTKRTDEDIYGDMVAEAIRSGDDAETRPLKKRRTGNAQSQRSEIDALFEDHGAFSEASIASTRPQQQILEESETAESDIDWEDVDYYVSQDKESQGQSAVTLSLEVNAAQFTPARKGLPRKKPAGPSTKKLRVHIHKMHVMCLLAHVYIRNAYCNDAKAQAALKKLINPRTFSFLNPDERGSQFQRDTQFRRGLQEINQFWATKYTVTAIGIRRSEWAQNEHGLREIKSNDKAEHGIERRDFRRAAVHLQGSQDLGVHLLCTLLRAAGVEARLVCSLQTLPLSAAALALVITDVFGTSGKARLYSGTDSDDNIDASQMENSTPAVSTPASSTAGVPPPRIRRIGQPNFGTGRPRPVDLGKAPPAAPKPLKGAVTPFPVYWIEAFNVAKQKWIAIDPFSTHTVDQPQKLEPPASQPEVQLCYAIAFESDGSAKDVTRRYAHAYNAKTRKARVESTEAGEEWFKTAMRIYKRRQNLDRDDIENGELSKYEAAEPMPRNVQDFKDHPYYALERHLRRNEVIHPRRECGRLKIGKAASKETEPIYRRRDVHVVRSADKWYRFGREIKEGEQPLKRNMPKQQNKRKLDEDEDEDDEDSRLGVGLYAPFQTQLYVPPPVVRGRVPKNAYGNLDVYVPSMVPAGGVHIRSQYAAKAAKIVGIDYSDAVVGFQFKGRQGTAVIDGIVVAKEYQEAVEAIMNGIVHMLANEEEERRSRATLRMWSKFLQALRITDRIQREYGQKSVSDTVEAGQDDETPDEDEEDNGLASVYDNSDFGHDDTADGGFFPEAAEERPMPARRARPSSFGPKSVNTTDEDEVEEDDNNSGEEYGEDDDGGGFLPEAVEDAQQSNQRSSANYEVDSDELEDGGSGGGTFTQGDNYTEPEERTAPIRRSRRRRIIHEDAEASADGFQPPDGDEQEGTVGNAEDHKLSKAGQDHLMGAGWFASEAKEESGGGFIAPDEDMIMEDTGSALERDGDGQPARPENDLTPSRLEPSLTIEHVQHQQALAPQESGRHESNTAEEESDQQGEAETTKGNGTLKIASPDSEHSAEDEVVASDVDRGSLLSHDPDDEDAEPEWLA